MTARGYKVSRDFYPSDVTWSRRDITPSLTVPGSYTATNSGALLSINLRDEKIDNFSNPDIWGPAFWFTIHNGANHYPLTATPIVKERMKGFILGLPEMIPCRNCQEHARAHIEGSDLNKVCVGRSSLFAYFVDFHNYVNKRYNKPMVSVEEAEKLYTNGVSRDVFSYGVQ